MSTATLDRKVEERQLTIHDRCDAACGSQAYVRVTGNTGSLFFCSHHYTKIMREPDSALAMTAFATDTLDERGHLSDKRAGL